MLYDYSILIFCNVGPNKSFLQEEVKTSFLDTLDVAVGTKDDETEDINAKNAKQMREQQDKRTHEE